MGDLVRFPGERSSPPWTETYRRAIDQIEDLAEHLAGPGICGHGELLNLTCRVLVARFGSAEALEKLSTAVLLVSSVSDPRPPRGAA